MKARLVLLTVGAAVAVLAPNHAEASPPEPPNTVTQVEGAADFRTAPTLGDGTYADEPLTGEAVWFALLISNGAELSVTANPIADRPDIEVEIGLIGPTLTTLSTERHELNVTRLRYGSDDNVASKWFLRLTPRSEGRRGEPTPIRFTVEGTSEPDAVTCDPDAGCSLHDDIAELEAAITQLSAELATTTVDSTAPDTPPSPTVTAEEVDALREEIAQLERDLADAQAASEPSTAPPEPTSDTRPHTGLVASAGLVGLITGAGFLIARRRNHASTPAAAPRDGISLDQPVSPPAGWAPPYQSPPSSHLDEPDH